ncbi:hypothetical protein [uncultured Intestinimonas sp.]|uniref:hypothetical protein n=1 Tax=uncultured Intestinimonas sp. TaxID=1689265 RepID=UPI0025E60564|nr:hypothetical protein [uncultured Intestinimonas sp.]
MNKIVLSIVGLLLILFAAVCPLPTILSVSGMVWRGVIGVLGCAMFAFGIVRRAHQH